MLKGFKKKFGKLWLPVTMLLWVIGNPVKAQTSEYSVHANIIYHLTKYMQWPGNAKDSDFIIGVIGEKALFEELENTTLNKTVGGRKIVVRSFGCKQNSYDCQILFISNEESSCLKRIATITADMPVLIITEREGLAIKGSSINFILQDGHLKLEINKTNIESRDIKIANELLGLGKIVQ